MSSPSAWNYRSPGTSSDEYASSPLSATGSPFSHPSSLSQSQVASPLAAATSNRSNSFADTASQSQSLNQYQAGSSQEPIRTSDYQSQSSINDVNSVDKLMEAINVKELLYEDIRITRWLNPLQNNPSGNAELAQIVGDASTVKPNATENLGYRYPCEDQAVFYSDANQPGPSNANTAIVRQRCFSDPAPIQQQHPCHFQFSSHNQFFPQQHPLPHLYAPVSQPQFHLMANQIPQPAQIRYSYSSPLPAAPQQTVKRGRPGRKPKNSGRQSPKQVIYKEGQQQGRRGNTPRLLPFTLRLLMNPQYRDIVNWTGVGLEFIITDRTRLAYIWGMHKSNRPMKYTNLARSFRYLGEKGLVAHSHKTFEFTFLPRFFEITPEFRMDEIHQYAQERGKEYQSSIRRQAN